MGNEYISKSHAANAPAFGNMISHADKRKEEQLLKKHSKSVQTCCLDQKLKKRNTPRHPLLVCPRWPPTNITPISVVLSSWPQSTGNSSLKSPQRPRHQSLPTDPKCCPLALRNARVVELLSCLSDGATFLRLCVFACHSFRW